MYTNASDLETGIAAIFAVLGIFLIFILAILILSYILFALGTTKIMKAKGMDDTYRAWIPFWNMYVLGSIVEEEAGSTPFVFNGTKWLFTFSGIIGVALSEVPYIGDYMPLVFALYILVCMAIVAKKYNSMGIVIFTSIIGWPGCGYLTLGRKMENLTQSFGQGYTGQDSKVGQPQAMNQNFQQYTPPTNAPNDDYKEY